MMRRRTSAPWTSPTAAMARVLGDSDVPEALRLCAVDPISSVLASSRLVVARTLGLRAAGGQVWGYPRTGPLEAVCWAGANLVPVVPAGLSDRDRSLAISAFADLAIRCGRRSSSVVGNAPDVLALWGILAQRWPMPREVRDDQPSMAIDRPPLVPQDPAVRLTTVNELEVVLPACIRMFTEEVGYSPMGGGGYHYTERVRSLIATRRSFARIEGEPPAVVFKAELGAVTEAVAQVQGVWVDPLYRGKRLSESGMAAVVAQTLREVAPVVSLYVNGFNERAIAAYRRVGFERVGTYATVLF